MQKKNFVLFGICLAVLFQTGCAAQKYLSTSDGVQIAYEYDRAENAAGTAVLLHGLGSDLNEWYTFRKQLRRAQWSALALDFRGHGLSTRWRNEELDWRNFTDEGRKTTVRDIEAALRFLRDSQNIWLIGSSFGANAALHYAASDPRIRGVVLLSAGWNYGGFVAPLSILSFGERPLLIVAAGDDPQALETAMVLYEHTKGPKALKSYPKGGHGTGMFEQIPQLEKEIIQWMNQHTATTRQNSISE